MGLSCRHGAEAVLSIPLARSASGRDAEAPERPGDKGGSVPMSLGAAQPGSPLPSCGLWLLLKLLLAAEESAARRCEHKARLCCPGDAPPLLPRPSLAAGAARHGATGWEAAHRLAKPPARQSWSPPPPSRSPQPFPRALETPRPLRRGSQAPTERIFYSFPPLGHSTEHTSP